MCSVQCPVCSEPDRATSLSHFALHYLPDRPAMQCSAVHCTKLYSALHCRPVWLYCNVLYITVHSGQTLPYCKLLHWCAVYCSELQSPALLCLWPTEGWSAILLANSSMKHLFSLQDSLLFHSPSLARVTSILSPVLFTRQACISDNWNSDHHWPDWHQLGKPSKK